MLDVRVVYEDTSNLNIPRWVKIIRLDSIETLLFLLGVGFGIGAATQVLNLWKVLTDKPPNQTPNA